MKYRELLSIAKKYPNCFRIDEYTRLSAEKSEDVPTVTIKLKKDGEK